MKQVKLEYGDGQVEVNVPDDADIFETGVTVKDPPALSDVRAATLEAIRHPLGLPTIPELVHAGSKIVIVFPDRVKGGYQEDSHRKTSIPLIVEECEKAGAREEDFLFICSNGLHRKNRPDEIRHILGDAIFDRFYPKGQIINHDSEDWDHLVDLGNEPKFGAKVVLNRYVYESDVCFLIGHCQGNPYGGYSGGYKHCATGISNWECISSHHCPQVMHRPDFVPVSSHSLMRQKFDAIGEHMENKMGKKFFCVDAVLDSFSRQIAVYAGEAHAVQQATWKIADLRTYVKWAKKKYNLVIMGLPNDFQYGSRQGRNPILVEQAIAAQVVRLKRVMSDHPVIIALAQCDGDFGDEEFPAMREVYDHFLQHGNTLPEIQNYYEHMEKAEYIRKYRFEYAFHPYHAFSMTSCAHIAERDCAAVYIVGAKNPGSARAMGMKTRSSVEEAIQDAAKYVGTHPDTLVLPMTFKRPSVHLCMAEGEDNL